MAYKVLVAPDKFKGTLTSQAAADAIARGWRRSQPEHVVATMPVSDGGDGFGAVLGALLEGKPQAIETLDAAHRPLQTSWWWCGKTKTAVIESANVIGLAQLPPRKFHPFELDTSGLAEVLRAAARKNPRRCILGIGGSATNDGGFGMARALGWQFVSNKTELPIQRWSELWSLDQIQTPKDRIKFAELLVAVDVQNPLLGPAGATAVYGPQKGIGPSDQVLAEKCLAQLAKVARAEYKQDFSSEPGVGAAGGLGFGLRCFLNARLVPGFQLFAELTRLVECLDNYDLVITGEGALDSSSLMGKGVGELAALCRAARKPCLGLAGVVTTEKANAVFTQVHALTPGLTAENEARLRADFWLEELAARVAAKWSPP